MVGTIVIAKRGLILDDQFLEPKKLVESSLCMIVGDALRYRTASGDAVWILKEISTNKAFLCSKEFLTALFNVAY